MDISTPTVSPLRQRMLDDMRMRKMAEHTQDGYIRAVRKLAAFLGRSPYTATIEELRRFQLHLVDAGTGPVTINATLGVRKPMPEFCAICQCELHRTAGTYARPNEEGRSHATRHHFVAERFFGRSSNRKGTKTDGIFEECPWGAEGKAAIFCYECHEELLHNPVLLPEDIKQFAKLVQLRGLSENKKSADRGPLAGRVRLFQEIIAKGLAVALNENTDA